ncbi:MAG: 2-C-methyl-D-erythritol 2,4-cyclodiphosphate synthase [Tindallia sp. MSAO_Bac2]|nr:MAG: 2-C-methyl-D-erythritol 2,4-cyclodiphosphate synthase [Tindallia sp. MSAO_Bac2]
MKIGIGFDVHRMEKNRKLILGGVTIPHEKGLAGHSDADVLVHAIMDALLGAAGLGDIGHHFPDQDEAYKNADSIKLMKHVNNLINQRSLMVSNLDAVVMAQNPKLAPHLPMMAKRIGEALETDVNSINIKATTTEKLGFVGREEGMAAQAVVLLKEFDTPLS